MMLNIRAIRICDSRFEAIASDACVDLAVRAPGTPHLQGDEAGSLILRKKSSNS